MTGLSAFRLRAWELRYQAVTPMRTSTGRRIYSDAEILRLKKLQELVLQGIPISQVARLSDRDLDDLGRSTGSSRSQGTSRLFIETKEALSKFDLEGVQRLLRQARLEMTVSGYLLDQVSPLFQWIGDQVSAGNLSIAQEHAFSALVRNQLGEILYSIPKANQAAPVVALATPSGELHEFGILIAAILCALHGLEVHQLGPNLPADSLALAANAVKADLVVLGTSSCGEIDRIYLTALVRNLRKGAKVWVGGPLAFSMIHGVDLKRKLESVADFRVLQEKLQRIVPKAG